MENPDLMVTAWIAIAIGTYSIAGGIGMLLDPARYAGMMTALRDNPALAYVIAFLAYMMGAILLIVHHRWDSWLAGLVTFTGLIAVIEGLAILVAAGAFVTFIQRWTASSLRFWGLFSIALGLVFVVGALMEIQWVAN